MSLNYFEVSLLENDIYALSQTATGKQGYKSEDEPGASLDGIFGAVEVGLFHAHRVPVHSSRRAVVSSNEK